MTSLTVRGEGVARGVPDEALVTLEVSVVRARPEEAFEEAAHRSGMLEQLLDELAVEAGDRSTVGITIGEEREYEGGRTVLRGYSATNRLVVRLREPETVAALVRDAVGRAEARVSGPEWHTAAENPARSAACREAALDACRRADAFAEGLALRVGAIVEAREPGTRIGGAPRSRADFSSMLGAEGDVIPYTPGEHDVHAALEVTFVLEQP